MTIQVISQEPKVEPAKEPVKTEASENKSEPEATASEQNESTESDPEETDAKGEEKSDESESNDEEQSDDNKEKPTKKKGGFQRRIDKLNARNSAAQQEIEYWKQQALRGAGESKTETKVETKQTSEGKPNPETFETHAEYVEALTDWKIDQKNKEAAQKMEKSKFESEQEKLVKSYTEKAKSFFEKTADFADVLAEVDDIPLSPTLQDIILSSENGPELAYELAKNREEFARVCKLSPLAAAREMGKLEARLASKQSAGTTEIKKTTKAPAPIKPVGSKGGTIEKDINDPNLSQKEYEALRAKQLAAK
jgi:hypothetical protein